MINFHVSMVDHIDDDAIHEDKYVVALHQMVSTHTIGKKHFYDVLLKNNFY